MPPSLPAGAIEEILALARNNIDERELPSPRGVADDFFPAPHGGGSPPDGAKADGPAAASLGPCPDEDAARAAVCRCARLFLVDVLGKTLDLAQYLHRTRCHPGDVAAALEYFVRLSDVDGIWTRACPAGGAAAPAEAPAPGDAAGAPHEAWDDEEWREDPDDAEGAAGGESEDEELMEEAIGVDDQQDRELEEWSEVERSHDPKGEELLIGTHHDLSSTHHPAFDAAYPPIASHEIRHLSKEEFRQRFLEPILADDFRCANVYDEDEDDSSVEDMLKEAMYSFIVAKLSSF